MHGRCGPGAKGESRRARTALRLPRTRRRQLPEAHADDARQRRAGSARLGTGDDDQVATAGAHVLIRLAGAVLLAAALAGCGSASSSDLERSADATAAETSRFELRLNVKGIELSKRRDFKFVASGLFDYPNERGLMRMDESDPSEDALPTEFRLIGKTGYERWVFDGKTYWSKDEEVETSDD